ncbi:BrnT family toxin [Methylobacterium sp. WL103]|uniref:BrnT family toxin n=1 Tax=unclassified Methylobacterium TaxID=2615210 RepID=UPI0011C7C60B|nr:MULTISPECIES: BrnT family toxin [unclassified Methylobacterium]TXM73554.1 BrnT family toxin [Methylobacterium sp. WL12]TXN00962.1 BrnT family toxin [Methylobacterium sp. WL103]
MDEPFDPGKDAINRERHGLSLAFGDRIMPDEAHLIIPSVRPQDGEEHFKAVGSVEGKLHTAVFTWRNGRPQFISVRRSNAGEGRAYHSGL